MIFNRTEKEEKAYLMDIIALLAANIEQMDKAIEDKSKDVNGAQTLLVGKSVRTGPSREKCGPADSHPNK